MNDRHEATATLIRRVRVFDGTSVGDTTSVLIEGSRIVAISPDIEVNGAVVDGGNSLLIPGFIDAHVHISSIEDLARLARAGVTTALDMGNWPAEFINDLRGASGLTDLRSAGIPATSPDSNHSKMPGQPESALVSSPDEAQAFVDQRLAEGSDYIKVVADVPGPDQETLNALVSAAHERGLITVAHAAALTPYRMSIAARSDVITHAPLDAALEDDTIKSMTEHSIVAVPTLTMMDAVATKFFGHGAEDNRNPNTGPVAGPGYHNARRSVGLLHRAGVPILAGTDANSTPGAPTAVGFGHTLHRELALLVDAGLEPVDAIIAATSAPARHFRLADRGMIRPGFRADLVLISGDPLTEISNSSHVERVWCGGIEVDR